jgi:hypothetical protein
MRSAAVLMACVSLSVAGFTSMAHAQNIPNAPSPLRQGSMPGPLSNVDVEKLRDLLDRDRKAPDARARDRAKQESATLGGALTLSCEIADAERVGGGRAKADGKALDVAVYEVACTNRTGYFLFAQGAQKPLAISCFAAEATHAADVAQGVKSQFYCQLPANKDVKATAAALMTAAGTSCAVSNARWFGMNASNQTEYSEVACADGKGYLLKTPLTGASAQTSVMSCQDAAKQGLKCHLTDGGAVSAPVTMQTFRDALEQNGVACEPAQMRVIGRESVDRRYVVEMQCPQQPRGLVAFVPAEGNPKPFEAIDCAAAAEREITCTLAGK